MVDTEIYGTDYSSLGFVTSAGDIGTVSDLENAKQAIHNRLLTRLGTYPSVDTEYGSEIYKIIGEHLNEAKINELMVYVTNCMLEEPRVQSIIELNIIKNDYESLMIELLVQLVDGTEIEISEEIDVLGV